MYRIVFVPLPALLSFVVALAACLPWGAPVPLQFALPLLTLAVIFYWTIEQPGLLPSPLVFLIGLFTDLATAGPLGYWALNYLIGVTIASYGLDRFAEGRGRIVTTAFFAVAVAVVSCVGWLLSSLFFLRPMPVEPLLEGGAIAIAAYQPITLLLLPIDRLVDPAVRALQLRGADQT
jgi:rod shape-determining protein MreD